jgi:hypothetical protein
MSEFVSIRMEKVEEVFGQAQTAQGHINRLVKENDDVDREDVEEIVDCLETIQRRTDPAIWKTYDR